MSKFFRVTSLLLVLSLSLLAQFNAPIVIVPAGPGAFAVATRGAAWSNAGTLYLYTPPNPNLGICTYITNNNQVNGHTFQPSLYRTADPDENVYHANGKWTGVPLASNGLQNVTFLGTWSHYWDTSGAAKVLLWIGSASPQAGAGEGYDLVIVQSSGTNCSAQAPDVTKDMCLYFGFNSTGFSGPGKIQVTGYNPGSWGNGMFSVCHVSFSANTSIDWHVLSTNSACAGTAGLNLPTFYNDAAVAIDWPGRFTSTSPSGVSAAGDSLCFSVDSTVTGLNVSGIIGVKFSQ